MRSRTDKASQIRTPIEVAFQDSMQAIQLAANLSAEVARATKQKVCPSHLAAIWQCHLKDDLLTDARSRVDLTLRLSCSNLDDVLRKITLRKELQILEARFTD